MSLATFSQSYPIIKKHKHGNGAHYEKEMVCDCCFISFAPSFILRG
ncbi:hypothetical protein LLB_2489 [Legionella longbeachae D-4968]|nr:hypothetical protein LLB_2489 [Legionella longbeachae D-4968]